MSDWKLILPYTNSTIIENSITNALNVCDRLIIVTGYRAEELSSLVKRPPKVLTIENRNFKRGMFSSIQTGAALVGTEWFFITMGDMPDITENIYKILLEARDIGSKDFDIIRPMYQGRRGHPVLMHKRTLQTIIREPVSSEMKKVLLHHRVLDIEMNIPQTFRDIDTPEEYKQILKTI